MQSGGAWVLLRSLSLATKVVATRSPPPVSSPSYEALCPLTCHIDAGSGRCQDEAFSFSPLDVPSLARRNPRQTLFPGVGCGGFIGFIWCRRWAGVGGGAEAEREDCRL